MEKIGLIIIIIGLISILLKRENYIIILISIELIIIGITILFINYSIYFNNIEGITTSIYLLIIGAAESAIGLTIILKLCSFEHKIIK